MSVPCDLGSEARDSPFLCGHTYHCQPCSIHGHHIQAMGYCVSCTKYLCRQCYSVHRIPPTSQGHVMLHKDHVTKRHPKVEEIFIDQCHIHGGESLHYFCEVHEEFACKVCKAGAHRQCTDIYLVYDAVENIHNSIEMRSVQSNMDDLIQRSSAIGHLAKANIAKRKTNDDNVLSDIKQFRQKMMTELDKLENEVKEKVKLQNKKETEKLERVSGRAYKVLKSMKALQEHFNTYMKAGDNSAVFRGMKQVSNLTSEMNHLLNAAESENHTEIYTFQAEQEIMEVIKSFTSFGKLCPEPKTIRASYKTQFGPQAKGDTRKCYITDIIVMDSMLLLCDNANSKVKVVDTKSNKITAQYPTESQPWNIAAISRDLYAVTLPMTNTLIYLQIWNKTLRQTGSVHMSAQCFGIAHKNARLIVSFIEPGCIKILDIRGNTLAIIDQDDLGQSLFNSPKHLAVSQFSLPTRIYVYDENSSKLTCITMEGQVLATYYSYYGNGPDKIVMDTKGREQGTVYMSGGLLPNLQVIAAQCEPIQVLLYHHKSMLTDTSMLYYVETNNILYLQDLWSENCAVQMYQIEDSFQETFLSVPSKRMM